MINMSQLAVWSSGMILASGVRGPGLNFQNSPFKQLANGVGQARIGWQDGTQRTAQRSSSRPPCPFHLLRQSRSLALAVFRSRHVAFYLMLAVFSACSSAPAVLNRTLRALLALPRPFLLRSSGAQRVAKSTSLRFLTAAIPPTPPPQQSPPHVRLLSVLLSSAHHHRVSFSSSLVPFLAPIALARLSLTTTMFSPHLACCASVRTLHLLSLIHI